jgi:hypothetical protein
MHDSFIAAKPAMYYLKEQLMNDDPGASFIELDHGHFELCM